MDFHEADRRRTVLSGQLARGQITHDTFTASVNTLRVTDAAGRTWQPMPAPAGWLCWNGTAWQPAMPPALAGTGPVSPQPQRSEKDSSEFKSSLMTVDEFRKVSKNVPLAKRPQKWWDLFSILGGVAAAVIWFLYGGIRSGQEGFDLITPLIMVAIPVILVWFRADLDKILLPLLPHRKKIPRLILIGLGIAVPFVTAWLLYNIFNISQYPLMQANIVVGTLVSYAVVRDPVLPQGLKGTGSRPLGATGISVILLTVLATLVVVPVLADDCIDDPFNAQDCLRTNGFAETLAGATAAGMGVLVNGPIIIQGIIAGGTAGSGKIYGTGTPGDPYRDSGAIGEVGKDGKITPYPESANQPPKIYGDGSVEHPYTDTPPPVFDHSPTPPDAPLTPPVPPVMPVSPTPPPAVPPAPVVPRTPVTPETPQPPTGPLPPVTPTPPVTPVQPPVPPTSPLPPQPPQPPSLTPQQRQELITQRKTLQQNIDALQVKWKRKKWLEKAVPEAYTKKLKQGLRANINTGKKIFDAVREPGKTIANGVKDKLGIKTEQDKREEKNPLSKTGKDVPQSEIIEDFYKAVQRWKELKAELDNMPSDDQMIDQMKRLTSKVSSIDGKLAGGK